MQKNKLRHFMPQLREVWRLSLPAILTQITTIAMQYIDSAMVGRLGANASAAIGLVASSTWLFNGVCYALSAGFSVQAAHRIGAGLDREARCVERHGLIAAAVVSALLCAVGIAIHRALPVWLGGGAEITRDAGDYFLMFSCMLPFTQLCSLASSFLQCAGDMLSPSILNAVMCVLDVIFNAIFIPKLGVLGAGLGTTLACAVMSVLILYKCAVKNPILRLRKEPREWKPEIFRAALRIGTPVAVQEVAMCGAQVVSTAIIAPLGAVAVAANAFAVTAESICYMPGYGIASAAAALVGRFVGAGDMENAKRYGNLCTGLGAALMTGTGAVMMLVCPLVFRMLTPVPEVQELAARVLRIELLAEPLFGVSIVAAGALRGAGDTLVPSLLNLGSIWLVRVGSALVLVRHIGLTGMWIAMAVELCIRGLLMLWRQKTSPYYREK